MVFRAATPLLFLPLTSPPLPLAGSLIQRKIDNVTNTAYRPAHLLSQKAETLLERTSLSSAFIPKAVVGGRGSEVDPSSIECASEKMEQSYLVEACSLVLHGWGDGELDGEVMKRVEEAAGGRPVSAVQAKACLAVELAQASLLATTPISPHTTTHPPTHATAHHTTPHQHHHTITNSIASAHTKHLSSSRSPLLSFPTLHPLRCPGTRGEVEACREGCGGEKGCL